MCWRGKWEGPDGQKNVSPDQPPCCAAAMLFVSLVRRGAVAMLFLSSRQCWAFRLRGAATMMLLTPARLRRQMISPRAAL